MRASKNGKDSFRAPNKGTLRWSPNGQGGRVARRISGLLVAAIATALTVAWVIALFQTVTGDFVGGEVGIVWSITGFVGVVTAGALAATWALLSKEPNVRRVFGQLFVAVVVALLVFFFVGF